MKQIHIDLETMGVRPTSQILSIGAITSDGKELYVEVDTSLYNNEFTTDDSTVLWWQKRGGFVPTTENLMSPMTAIHRLVTWMQEVTADSDDFEVWAKSPAFDCVILQYHMRRFSLKCPWRHWQERDVRTVQAIGEELRIRMPRPRETAHHALQDAKDQMALVGTVQATLRAQAQQVRDLAFVGDIKAGDLA